MYLLATTPLSSREICDGIVQVVFMNEQHASTGLSKFNRLLHLSPVARIRPTWIAH